MSRFALSVTLLLCLITFLLGIVLGLGIAPEPDILDCIEKPTCDHMDYPAPTVKPKRMVM